MGVTPQTGLAEQRGDETMRYRLMEKALKQHLISLEYVKMALERNGYLVNTRAAAVSRHHPPMKGRGEELLHGACVVYGLK